MEKEVWEFLEKLSSVGTSVQNKGKVVAQTSHLEMAYWNFFGCGRKRFDLIRKRNLLVNVSEKFQ